ncbi:hypothetical protein ACFLQJ_01010 [Calditrichota bacterium]
MAKASSAQAGKIKRINSSILLLLGLGLTILAGCGKPIPSELKEKIKASVTSDSKFTSPIFDQESQYDNFDAAKLTEICDQAIENRKILIDDLKDIDPGEATALKQNLLRFLELENEAFEFKKVYNNIMEEFIKLEDTYQKMRAQANEIQGDQWGPLLDGYKKKLTVSGEKYRKVITDYRNVADRLDTMGELISEDLKTYRIKTLLSYAKYSGLDDASFLYWRRKVDRTLSSF